MGAKRTHWTCTIPGCDLEHEAKGLCKKHYKRRGEQKDSLQLPSGRLRPIKDFNERIETLTDRSTGCWIWLGWKDRDGYGSTSYKGKARRVHRAAYDHFKGPIPEGMTIDHLCRNRACCNPDHLEAVTNRENLLRGEGAYVKNSRKTHCLRGHEFTPENTRVSIDDRGLVHRHCKACRKRQGVIDARRWRARKRAEQLKQSELVRLEGESCHIHGPQPWARTQEGGKPPISDSQVRA